MKNTDIVVGIDGSEPSRAALRWVATEARRRGARLRVLAAYRSALPGARFGAAADLDRLAREPFEDLVAEAVADARAMQPGIDVTGSAVPGEPGPKLVDAGRSSAIVVVGNRGNGGFGSLLLGSVSQQVATHARNPIVVVRGRADATAGPVVVGVDDSPFADRALEMAFEEAMHRGCVLFAVRAVTVPDGPRGINVRPLHSESEALRRDAAGSLNARIMPWRDKYPAVAVETLVGLGSAGKILVEASQNAGLLVVGSRGHGALVGTLLGSVGLQLLHHAECPVMIVHEARSG